MVQIYLNEYKKQREGEINNFKILLKFNVTLKIIDKEIYVSIKNNNIW